MYLEGDTRKCELRLRILSRTCQARQIGTAPAELAIICALDRGTCSTPLEVRIIKIQFANNGLKTFVATDILFGQYSFIITSFLTVTCFISCFLTLLSEIDYSLKFIRLNG